MPCVYKHAAAHADGDQSASDAISSFLAVQQQSEALTQQVVGIVESVGFKDELGAAAGRAPLSIEAAVVQDADRCVRLAQTAVRTADTPVHCCCEYRQCLWGKGRERC